MSWTIAKLIDWATGYFAERGIDSPRLDAEVLLGKVLGYSRIELYTHFDQPLGEKELQDFKSLLKRRASREPLAYILGEKEFFSLHFTVSPDVLIPRPETEGIVELGLDFLQKKETPDPLVLDLGTGSGCLIIALLKNFPNTHGVGLDCEASVLAIAKKNAEIHGVESRVQWIKQDLREEWRGDLQGPFDLIVANLPYISESDYLHLAPELRGFEPKRGLVPGPRGTEAFEWVLPHLPKSLKPGGWALLEIGCDQGGELLSMEQELCPELKAEILPDLSGLDRILKLRKPLSTF